MALLADGVSSLLIDGKLASGSHGTFATINPATEEKVFLELGGKSAFVVLDDADLNGACPVAAVTASMHAGQGCALTTWLVVPRARYDEAVAIAAGTMGSIKPGDPSKLGTVCGPVISARQRDRVQSYLDLAIAEGGTFGCGGGRPIGMPDSSSSPP